MRVRVLQQPAPHVEGKLGHWGREGHKKEETSHCASRGKEMQKTLEWQIHSNSCAPTAGIASRDNIVCWYFFSNIFGSQLFDHLSDIILFRVFNLPIYLHVELQLYMYRLTPITFYSLR